jgi:hypothetical protein
MTKPAEQITIEEWLEQPAPLDDHREAIADLAQQAEQLLSAAMRGQNPAVHGPKSRRSRKKRARR